jgi:hypothetical protein
MARYSNVQSNFSGGLVSDYILGRTDLKKLPNAARKFTNFFPTLQGPAEYRNGFKYLSTETSLLEDSVSQIVTLSTGADYRVVFTSLQVKIYKVEDNVLKSTLTTPYSTGDLKDLRFSAETDSLHIAHPSYRPAKLTSGLVVENRSLNSNDNRSLYSDEDGSGQGTTTTGDRPLHTTLEVTGDTNWSLDEIDFEVEPFLPDENSTVNYTLSQGERYIKIEAATQFATIKADWDAAPAGQFGQTWYVEYQQGGEWLLAKVVDSSESTNYTIEDPTNDVVYAEPVQTVLDINDPDARLFLLDNVATTNGSVEENALKIDGVPDGEIHVRSDVLVFRKGFEGAWLRVADDRRAQEVVVGHLYTNTRWLKIKEHLGTEDHPVDFIRGQDPFDEDNLTQGSTYKWYTNGTGTNTPYYIAGPNTNGELKVTTGVMHVPGGNRTFTFVNTVTDNVPHSHSGSLSVPTFSQDEIVGNLTTSKQFDVVKIDTTAPNVEQNGTITNNLVTVTGEPVITFIANDATLVASSSVFISSEVSVGRYFMGEFISGNVFMKGIEFSSGTQIKVSLLNTVPKSSRTLQFENGGQLSSLRFGAWFTGNYPKTVVKYEQRRVYGGTFSDPNYIFFSRVGNELDFSPTQDDKSVLDTDGFVYELSNRTAAVTWLLPLNDLVIGTSGGLYRIVPNQYQYGVSPKTARIELTQEEPCDKQGVIVGNSIFYIDASGTRLLEYKYETNLQNSSSDDRTKLVYPVFNTDLITKVVYQHTPIPKLWCLTESGKLYCLVYHRQEEYYAWCEQKHANGDSKILDVVVQPKANSTPCDTVLVAVKKNNVYTYEILNELQTESSVSGWSNTSYLDSYKVYVRDDFSNSIPFSLTGSTTPFEEGDFVDLVVNGEYLGNFEIEGTQELNGVSVTGILNDTNTQTIFVGYKYEGELQSIFPTWDGANKPSFASENMRVISTKPFLLNSVHYSIGVDSFDNRLVYEKSGYNAGVHESGELFTGFDKEIPIKGSTFGVDKVPTIKQTKPYPLTVASLLTKTDLN